MRNKHLTELNADGRKFLREEVFPKMRSRNAVLFIGAGASVGEKKYLSSEIISYHSALEGLDIDETDITKYVDILSSLADFDRAKFDDFISSILRKLKPTATHKIILSIPWKEIITTNFDTVIEQTFDLITGTPNENLQVKTIHNLNDYNYVPANEELKYVKLNGCICDNTKYPLIISSKDFESVRPYHKQVIKSLQNTSHKVIFLTIGYGFNDKFSEKLFDYFNSFNVRKNNPIYRVDPSIKKELLPYYEDQDFSIIKLSSEDFFNEYNKWIEETDGNTTLFRDSDFRDNNNTSISLSHLSKLNIADNILQYGKNYKRNYIDPKDFYLGKEPNLNIIMGEYDVSSKDVIDNVHLELNRCIEANDSTLVPVLLLTGRYGIGKTTIMYRAIHDYVLKGGGKAQAFEVLNLDKIKISALDELFKKTNAEIILLNVDHIEIDSAFKNLIKFRNELSIEQFAEYKVILISSIRENILQKHLLRKSYKSIKQIEVSNKLDEDLAGELIKKLESVKLLRFRDQREKQKHIKKIQKEYNGEPFIALTNLLDNTNHNRIIIDAFNQLSEHTKKAVIYTSFLHRFSLMMPSTLLRRLVGLEWDDFIQKIITFDSKGLLIQFENHSSGVEPDIYFHTPHQLLADDVVKLFYPKEDSRFYMYVEIIKKIEVGLSSAKLIVDLLKGLRLSEDLSQEKINKLFDSCPQELELDPHFMIHYSLNIQYRYEEKSIKKALEKITYLQSVLDSRNHFLIHRRATLNFQLAKLNYDREKELDKTLEYIKEARDLFNLKLIIDPFSSYSYINFVQMEIWYLSKAKLNRVDELRQISIIEDLISQGEQKAFENVHNISELRKDLSRIMTVEMGKNEEEILNNLDEMKLDSRYAAYAFILEFYIYEKKDDKPKLEEVVNNLNEYIHLDEVAKVLFKYYGKNLHQFENRMIFEKIVNNNKNLEKQYPVLYHYYNYVIEAYKHHFSLSKDHLYSLRANFKYLNPQLTEVWRNEVTNEPEIFEGIVKKNKYGSFKVAVVELTQTFGLKKSSYKNIDLSSNSKHKVKLYFYLTGIRAELIS